MFDHIPKRSESMVRAAVAVVFLLFVIWYLLLRSKDGRSVDTQLDEDMRMLLLKVQLYADSTGGLPGTLQKLVRPEEGMRQLVSKLPLDPWGRPYRLATSGRDYTITSDGADQQSSTQDDVEFSGTWTPKAAAGSFR